MALESPRVISRSLIEGPFSKAGHVPRWAPPSVCVSARARRRRPIETRGGRGRAQSAFVAGALSSFIALHVAAASAQSGSASAQSGPASAQSAGASAQSGAASARSAGASAQSGAASAQSGAASAQSGAASAQSGAASAQSGPASAQSEQLERRTTARRMAEDAANLYEGGRYDQARDLFHRANALYSAPALQLWEARSLEKLGRLVEAEELYSAVARYQVRPEDARIVREVVRDSAAELEKLRVRIPTLTIAIRGLPSHGHTVHVQLDERTLSPALIEFPIPVDAGLRVVRVVVDGRELAHVDVAVAEGDRKSVDLDVAAASEALAAAAPPFGPSQKGTSLERLTQSPSPAWRDGRARASWRTARNFGWIGAGAGLAGLAVGTVTGIVAMRKHSSLEQRCPADDCPPQYRDDLASFRGYRTASTVAYVVGGLGLAAGVTLLLAVPSMSHGSGSASVSLQVSPVSAELAGQF